MTIKLGLMQKVELNLPVILFVSALLVWVYVPIVGIFLLLLFVHLDRNSKIGKPIKNIIFLIAALTVTIFCSSIDISSDTAIYLEEYKFCTDLYFIDCIEKTTQSFEPGFYLLSSLFSVVSGGSERGFLFLWSLTINFLTIFIICRGFSKKYQALLVILVLINPAFYFQTFLMRQFMATSLFLCAIVARHNKLISFFCFIASILNHYTILIYLPFIFVALISKEEKLSNQSRNNYWRNYALFIMPLIGLGITSSANKDLFASMLSVLDSSDLSFSAQKGAFFLKVDGQGGLNGHSFLITIITIVYIYIAIQIYKKQGLNPLKFYKNSVFDKIITSLYAAEVFLFVVSRNIDDQLALRLCFLLISYIGLFFYFPLEKQNFLGKFQGLSLLAVIFFFLSLFLFFGNFLYNMPTNPFNFFGGNPFISLPEYIYYISNSW
jgi:EpsG family